MTQQPISGILNVDKPPGWTSHDVVGLVRRLAGQRQVGHAGTLDPLASGVLLILLGAATRLSDYVMHGRKCYLARLRLGLRTSTDDAEGEVVQVRSTDAVTREGVIAALAEFRGAIEQVPPAYAAIKQAGVPAYRRARRGEAPQLPPRPVRIDGLALVAMEGDVLDILVWCSAGTYIRALARDIGEVLGCGAHLAALRRLSSGSFDLESSSDVPTLRHLAAAGRLDERVCPMDEALASWPALVCDDVTAAAVLHGNPIRGIAPLPRVGHNGGVPGHAIGQTPAEGENGARLYGRDGRLLALARYEERTRNWQPTKVLAAPRPDTQATADARSHA